MKKLNHKRAERYVRVTTFLVFVVVVTVDFVVAQLWGNGLVEMVAVGIAAAIATYFLTCAIVQIKERHAKMSDDAFNGLQILLFMLAFEQDAVKREHIEAVIKRFERVAETPNKE